MGRKKKKFEPTLELIQWEDHWEEANQPWYKPEEMENHKFEPVIILQVGWVLKEDDKGILLCAQIGDNDAFGAQTYIMKSAIKERRLLK